MEQLVVYYFSNYFDFHHPNLAIDYRLILPTHIPNLVLVRRTVASVVVVAVAAALNSRLVFVKQSAVIVAHGEASATPTSQLLPIHYRNEGSNLNYFHPNLEYELHRDHPRLLPAMLRLDLVPQNEPPIAIVEVDLIHVLILE